jgi:hypothetical protein
MYCKKLRGNIYSTAKAMAIALADTNVHHLHNKYPLLKIEDKEQISCHGNKYVTHLLTVSILYSDSMLKIRMHVDFLDLFLLLNKI